MPNIDAPDLTVSLSSSNFQNEINANFMNQDEFNASVAAILNVIDYSELSPYSSILMRDVPMMLNLVGSVGSSQGSLQELGFIVPYDCLMVYLFVRAEKAPSSGTAGIDVKVATDTSEGTTSLLSSIATIDDTEANTIKKAYPRSDPLQLDEMDFIEVHVTEEAGSLSGLENLQLVLTITPRDWDVFGASI